MYQIIMLHVLYDSITNKNIFVLTKKQQQTVFIALKLLEYKSEIIV
jgi:hypothetical protein